MASQGIFLRLSCHDSRDGANTPFSCVCVCVYYMRMCANLLIQRLSVQQVLEVSPEWKTNKSESQYTWLEYDFRVTCDPHYYGSGCANLCRPRDDQFGHYTCSETGEIICLSGWQGNYCDKPKCAKGCEHGHCDKPNQCM
uniref:Delta-like protein n=1 Tax=Glossina palpalis gambiensis TaxID=67801 RepID=A0A1B0C6W7_9MUSC